MPGRNGGKRTSGRGRPKGSSNAKNKSGNSSHPHVRSPNVFSPAKLGSIVQTDTQTPNTKNGASSTNVTDKRLTYASSVSPTPLKGTKIDTFPAKAFEKNDQNTTLKSSEKPPDSTQQSFKEVVNETAHLSMSDFTHKTTFMLQKELYESKNDEIIPEIPNGPSEFSNSVRMTMMFKLPSVKEGCVEEEAATVAVKKINEMLKVLSNKLPCRVGPWNITNLKNGTPKLTDLLTELPVDIDFVESYIFDFNRFIQPGKMDMYACTFIIPQLPRPQK